MVYSVFCWGCFQLPPPLSCSRYLIHTTQTCQTAVVDPTFVADALRDMKPKPIFVMLGSIASFALLCYILSKVFGNQLREHCSTISPLCTVCVLSPKFPLPSVCVSSPFFRRFSLSMRASLCVLVRSLYLGLAHTCMFGGLRDFLNVSLPGRCTRASPECSWCVVMADVFHAPCLPSRCPLRTRGAACPASVMCLAC